MSSLPTLSGGNIRWAETLSPRLPSAQMPLSPYRCLAQFLLCSKELCIVAPSTTTSLHT